MAQCPGVLSSKEHEVIAENFIALAAICDVRNPLLALISSWIPTGPHRVSFESAILNMGLSPAVDFINDVFNPIVQDGTRLYQIYPRP